MMEIIYFGLFLWTLIGVFWYSEWCELAPLNTSNTRHCFAVIQGGPFIWCITLYFACYMLWEKVRDRSPQK